MKELIKITEQNGSKAVSARELHLFLEVETRFDIWIKRMFEYGFEENRDYETCTFLNINNQQVINYSLSLDCAKEISMLQRSDRGKLARRYFIEKEKEANLKQANTPSIQSLSRKQLALMVIQAEEEKEKLLIENSRLDERTQFVDIVFKADDLLTGSQVCKALNLPYGNITLYKKLREMGIFFKNKNEPKQEYVNKGYFRVKEVVIGDMVKIQTYITQKGLGFIAKKLSVVVPKLDTIKILNA